MTKCLCKLFIEVTCSCVEVRLEDCSNLLVSVEFLKTFCTLQNLLWMMRIVREEYMAIILYLEVETAINTTVCLHSIAQFFCRTAIELSHSHCRDTVFNVDRYWLSKLHILYIFNRRNEVESDSSVFNSYVLSMEIAFVAAVVIDSDTFLYVWFHL